MKGVVTETAPARQQECTVRSLYFTGAVYAVGFVAGLVLLAYARNWSGFLLWLVFIPFLKWAYLRFFPRISVFRGYGLIGDKMPAETAKAPVKVTYYSLLGCPFCPIVERRLKVLQKEMDFTLQTVDLTLRPRISEDKKIRSVPVVEVGGDRLVGNATTEQLAELIGRSRIASGFAPAGAP